jgi:hypothetical protein
VIAQLDTGGMVAVGIFLAIGVIYYVARRLNRPRRLLKEKEFREWRRMWARKDEKDRVAKQRELARMIAEEVSVPDGGLLKQDLRLAHALNNVLVAENKTLKRLLGWDW